MKHWHQSAAASIAVVASPFRRADKFSPGTRRTCVRAVMWGLSLLSDTNWLKKHSAFICGFAFTCLFLKSLSKYSSDRVFCLRIQIKCISILCQVRYQNGWYLWPYICQHESKLMDQYRLITSFNHLRSTLFVALKYDLKSIWKLLEDWIQISYLKGSIPSLQL